MQPLFEEEDLSPPSLTFNYDDEGSDLDIEDSQSDASAQPDAIGQDLCGKSDQGNSRDSSV